MSPTTQADYEAIPLVSPGEESSPTNQYKPLLPKSRCAEFLQTLTSLLLLIATTASLWSLLLRHPTGDNNEGGNVSLLEGAGTAIARTLNGSYRGLRLDELGQQLWLGMPYASPPVGRLRFRHPQPFAETWDNVRSSTEYGPHCPGYGDHEAAFPHSEDCLTINVVRPMISQLLPVGVFIHGGMNHGGGSSDPRYNLSFLVQTATNARLPFIAVSFNYRASMWGFISGRQVLGTGNANLGLHDQRLALRWVQENIAAFGGDATKVTIWGGSSGADDVGFHLLAYGGRDDHLFRAAIMQSGSPVAKIANAVYGLQDMYDKLVMQTGCASTEDSLDCLRGLPYGQLNGMFEDAADGTSPRMKAFSMPSVDGGFIPTFSSLALKERRMVKVPIITGIMTNEGSSSIPLHVRVWADEREHLISNLNFPVAVADHLMSLYPPVTKQSNDLLDPALKSMTSLAEFQRIESLEGDLSINAADRLQCEAFTDSGAGCYSFRFNAAIPTALDPRLGVTHASEIAPLFQNVDGLGFTINPFSGRNDNVEFYRMARIMGIMWAGFIVGLDPNAGLAEANGGGSLHWPKFSRERRERMVFNSTGPWVERDFGRIEAMKYINDIQHGVMDV